MRKSNRHRVEFIIDMILNNETNQLNKFKEYTNLQKTMFHYYKNQAYQILVNSYYNKSTYYDRIIESLNNRNTKLNQKILTHNE